MGCFTRRVLNVPEKEVSLHDFSNYLVSKHFSFKKNGETLIICLAHIDLNPVRAGIVRCPEDYRWKSLGYHVQADNKDGFSPAFFACRSSVWSIR